LHKLQSRLRRLRLKFFGAAHNECACRRCAVQKKEKHMTLITRIASVAIGVMTQTIFVGILIGA
jgi:hypothetical protein